MRGLSELFWPLVPRRTRADAPPTLPRLFCTLSCTNTDPGYGNLNAKITFIWAAAIALFSAFIYFFVPEVRYTSPTLRTPKLTISPVLQTKGLSLVQVDELYLSRVPAWRSSSWVPFGGASKRNAADGASLKLQTTQKHHENAQPRNLDDDEE